MDRMQDESALSEAVVRRSTLYLTLTGERLEGVIAESDGQPIVHHHLLVEGAEAVRHYLSSRELLHPFARTLLFADESRQPYTLVPRDFVRGGVTPGQWLPDLPQGHCLRSFTLPDLGCDLVFTTTEETYDLCQSTLHEPVYVHPVAPLTLTGAVYSRRSYPRVLLASVTGECADLVFCERGRVRLANRFAVTCEADLLYYITLAWEHFHLDPEEDHLLLFADEEAPDLRSARHLTPDAFRHLRADDYSDLTDYAEALEGIHSPTLRLALICGL